MERVSGGQPGVDLLISPVIEQQRQAGARVNPEVMLALGADLKIFLQLCLPSCFVRVKQIAQHLAAIPRFVPVLDLHALAVIGQHGDEVRAGPGALSGPERFQQARRQRASDCILVIDEGVLVQYGTHEELLLDKNGLYGQMDALQNDSINGKA